MIGMAKNKMPPELLAHFKKKQGEGNEKEDNKTDKEKRKDALNKAKSRLDKKREKDS